MPAAWCWPTEGSPIASSGYAVAHGPTHAAGARAGEGERRMARGLCELTLESRDAIRPMAPPTRRAMNRYRLLSAASYGSRLPDFARPRDTM